MLYEYVGPPGGEERAAAQALGLFDPISVVEYIDLVPERDAEGIATHSAGESSRVHMEAMLQPGTYAIIQVKG